MNNPTIVDQTTAAGERLAAIRAEIEMLTSRRDSLMLTTQAELAASGIASFLIARSRRAVLPEVGQFGVVVETFFEFESRIERDVDFYPGTSTSSSDRRDAGPHMTSSGFLIDHGGFEVMLRDDRCLLVAQVDEARNTEAAHARAVSRLRNLAQPQSMRVRVRDREVSLITPMNDTVHLGDVISAFKWLTGTLDFESN